MPPDRQLPLFPMPDGVSTPAVVPPPALRRRWSSSGAGVSTAGDWRATPTLLRAPGDPARSERPEGGRHDRAPHRTLKRMITVEQASEQIRALLADGIARTFNRIGVELLDQTADMLLGSPYDAALW